ncbi:MAG: DUF839 domain-containing protein [Gammaproteobacteria bacterium]|nr:DUF839 domain-containing protein [Gammaproteobacteria bacterium]
MLNRRQLLTTAATSLAFLGLRHIATAEASAALPGWRDLGAPRPDPMKILDLAAGFNYSVVARVGQPMDDGLLYPGDPDGMAAFAGADGTIVLVCNHELSIDEIDKSPFGADAALLGQLPADHLFDSGLDRPCLGGTTTLHYDPVQKQLRRSFLSLAGTDRNCAGGPTPWGSWLSCEESTKRANGGYKVDHGWVFEVSASAESAVLPVPLRAMGRFNHEACAVDPSTGIVYMTEDRSDSLLYRFIPDQRGKLAAGGRLQALALAAMPSADARNWPDSGATILPVRQDFGVRWIELDDVHSPDDDLRLRGHAGGAAIFARGEGMWFGHEELFFACTSGGPDRLGQIYRYRPRSERIDLFVESSDARLMKNCDNLTVTPWGDLMVCEDRPDGASLIGVTPHGQLYEFARNAHSSAELCGVCFSPDGNTLFVNIQDDGLTLAIHGPFSSVARS